MVADDLISSYGRPTQKITVARCAAIPESYESSLNASRYIFAMVSILGIQVSFQNLLDGRTL